MTLEYFVTSLIIVLVPGTGALYTMSAGLARGARASAVAAVGCTLGIVPHIVAAITGLAALLNASATAFQIIKYLGVAYLLYMAVATLRDKGALVVEGDNTPKSPWQVIRTGILINILNPKLTIFFFAFLPQFVPRGSHDTTLRLIVLSLIFMLMTFLVFVIYGRFAAVFRDRIVERPAAVTGMRRAFAGMFVALAGVLAFSDL